MRTYIKSQGILYILGFHNFFMKSILDEQAKKDKLNNEIAAI